jgi:hypothetical protein
VITPSGLSFIQLLVFFTRQDNVERAVLQCRRVSDGRKLQNMEDAMVSYSTYNLFLLPAVNYNLA